MALWEIEMQDGAKYQVESDTEPTEADVADYLSQSQQEHPSAPTTEEQDSSDGYSYADAIASGVYNLADTALFGLGSAAVRSLGGQAAIDKINAFTGQHPTASTVGEIGGFFVGAPAAAAKVGLRAGTKAAEKLAAKYGTSVAAKTAQWATKAGAIAAATEGEFMLQKTMQRAAGTREWEEDKTALEEFTEGSAWNIALQGALGTAGSAVKKIGNLMSADVKAVRVMGGKENVFKAQQAYRRAINAGASDEEASNVFMASIAQGLDDKSLELFSGLIRKDSNFAKFAREQMAGANQIVENTIEALTRPEYQKYSKSILDNLFGRGYKNSIGSTDIDYTAQGIEQLLGTNTKQGAIKRAQGIARAEARVASSPELASEAKGTFKSLVDDLMYRGSRDYENAASKIEPGDIKSFAGSEFESQAREQLAHTIEAFKQAHNGQAPTKVMVDAWKRSADRQAARRHLDSIMSEGTESVQTMEDIKEFFKRVNEAQVVEGQSAALGAFNEGVNSKILDGLDPVVRQSNQALRYAKTLKDMHKFGDSFTPNRMNELESALSATGLTAEEKAAKLAAFKMGWLNKLTRTATLGERAEFNKLYQVMSSKRGLGQYFSPQEIGEFMTQLRPKMEASVNIKELINASERFSGEPDLAPQLIRMGVGAVTGSRNTLANAGISWTQKHQFGPATARRIMSYVQNPSAQNFNIMLKGTSDLAEKTMLNRFIVDALKAEAIQQQAVIRVLEGGASIGGR